MGEKLRIVLFSQLSSEDTGFSGVLARGQAER
jgi:hypothetical protein